MIDGRVYTFTLTKSEAARFGFLHFKKYFQYFFYIMAAPLFYWVFVFYVTSNV